MIEPDQDEVDELRRVRGEAQAAQAQLAAGQQIADITKTGAEVGKMMQEVPEYCVR